MTDFPTLPPPTPEAERQAWLRSMRREEAFAEEYRQRGLPELAAYFEKVTKFCGRMADGESVLSKPVR